MAQKIVLVRHGRSAHVHAGWIDRAGFERWRAAYEAAGIDERDEPPAELKTFVSSGGIVVSSDAPRAVQSAALLVPRNGITVSPLLAELELAPPDIRGVRMPLIGWAVAIGVRSLFRRVSSAELARSREAADWLSGLAERHQTVVAVTHASFRSLVAKRLVELGWRVEIPRRRTSHWSVWAFERPHTS